MNNLPGIHQLLHLLTLIKKIVGNESAHSTTQCTKYKSVIDEVTEEKVL